METIAGVFSDLRKIGYECPTNGELWDADNVHRFRTPNGDRSVIICTRGSQEKHDDYWFGVPLSKSAKVVVLWMENEDLFYVVHKDYFDGCLKQVGGIPKVDEKSNRHHININPNTAEFYFTGCSDDKFSLKEFSHQRNSMPRER